jgi:hypothetical protein
MAQYCEKENYVGGTIRLCEEGKNNDPDPGQISGRLTVMCTCTVTLLMFCSVDFGFGCRDSVREPAPECTRA